jgi:spore coat protein CotH
MPTAAPAVPESGCEAPDASTAMADVADLFGHPRVPVFDFHLPPAEWEALQRNALAEEYVPVAACFEGRAIGTVGLRFKGFYGSLVECFDDLGNQVCPRLSMKAKFDKYVEEQRFHGLKRLNFHAYRHDDSRMKERLTYDLYREMGIVAPRAAWAVVRVNGQSLGLYGMVEEIDGRFTADRWPEHGDGNLYKEVWPTETDPAEFRAALRTNTEEPDVTGFETFAAALTSAPREQALATLSGYTDVAYLARYMAVDDAVANYDGVTYFWTDGSDRFNHNYYFYEDAPQHFTLVPWDVEATFWINPDHAAPHWTELPEDCSLSYPYWSGLAAAPGCDVVFQALLDQADAWKAASRELLDGPFAVDAMLAKIDAYEAFLVEEAHRDPTPPMYTSFGMAVQNLRDTVPALRSRLARLIGDE